MRFPAVETVAGWSRLLGISKYLTRKLMKEAGVPIQKRGGYPVIYLCDIRQNMPSLWESFRLRRDLPDVESSDE